MDIIFCDIDGTFIGESHIPKQINLDAINLVKKQGHEFVLVSGRGHIHIKEFVEQYNIECPYIFANGSGLQEPGKEPSYWSTLSKEDCITINGILKDSGLIYYMHIKEGIVIQTRKHLTAQIENLAAWYSTLGIAGETMKHFLDDLFLNANQVDDIGDFIDRNSFIAFKFELLSDDEVKKEQVTDELKSKGYNVYSSFMNNREITLNSTTKGAAIRQYLKNKNFNHTIAIGDGENDIDMLMAVDYPVAVKNAKPTIKILAKEIIGDSENGSVGEFLYSRYKKRTKS